MATSRASSGKRDRFVTIQQMTESVGGSGRPVETWANLGKAWMERQDVTGWERLKSEGLSSRFDTRWKMGYQENMDPETLNVPKFRRLVYAGRMHDITSASAVGLHEDIELLTIAKG